MFFFYFWLLAFARKIMVLPESGGAAAPKLPWLVRLMLADNHVGLY